MFNATLEPLISECKRAIELAESGDIEGARSKLDRIRYLRSVISRTKQKREGSEEALTAIGLQDADLVNTYTQLAVHANALLEVLREWIKSSRASFTMDQLRASREGLQLFIDDALPGIWDFTQDIAVLTERDGNHLREALRSRGQRRFVWLTDQTDHDSVTMSPETEADDKDTLFVAVGEEPDVDALKELIGEGVLPRVALLAHQHSPAEEHSFVAINQAVASAIIKAATAQWISIQTTEQYLGNLSTLVKCSSAMALRPQFMGADVLILSPGPSLRHDFGLLKKYASRFITVAPVKSLEALFDEGISPDFAIWQDPQDHSYAVPDRPQVAETYLILAETCHERFFEAGFKECIIYPDPLLLATPITRVLHGDILSLLAGTCVSSLAVVLATALGAKSVTLLGQDLSTAGGQYVSPGAVSAEQSEGDPNKPKLMCEAIGGGQLPTQPNYYGFIGEFKLIGQALNDHHTLINCTASGAFLEGWEHMPFAQHPLLETNPEELVSSGAPLDLPEIDLVSRQTGLHLALEELQSQLQRVMQCTRELVVDCLNTVNLQSNDISDVDKNEQQLKELLGTCHILRNYISPQSMAMQAAAESNLSLEDNLRLSADYYETIFRSASKLELLCTQARDALQ